MADSRDGLNGADEASTAYAHYLLRTSVASAHALHLFEQVIGCVARRQLTPAALHDSLIRFAPEHAPKSAANVSAAAARFIAGLASSAFLNASTDEAPIELEANDLAVSIARVAERTRDRTTQALEEQLTHLATIATRETTIGESRRATTKQIKRMVTSELSRTARLWFEFLGTVDEERGRLAEQYFMRVLRDVSPIGFDSDVVELSGRVNTKISTVVTLDNARNEPAVLHCGVSDVRRADGVGPAFLPEIALAPSDLVVESRQEAQVQLSLWLDSTIYDGTTPYIGSLYISRDDAPRLDIPLRITRQ